jgi:hypothetical protein
MKPGINFSTSIHKAVKDCGLSSDSIRENGIVVWMRKSASTKVRNTLVQTEALVIWIIALPVGMLCSLGAMVGVIAAVKNIDPENLEYLRLTASAWPFLLTAILSFTAMMFSARRPIKNTMKLPMIEAVRGNAVYRTTVFSETERDACSENYSVFLAC